MNPRGVLIGAAVVLISGCGTTVTGVKTSGGGNQGLSVPSVPGAVGPTSGGGPGTSSTAARRSIRRPGLRALAGRNRAPRRP